MSTVYLALGSNVGDSAAAIEQAVFLLGEKITNIRQAPLYHSKAAGFTDQPDFLNTAVCGQTELTPRELLAFCQATEVAVGRIRRFHWGPREIDIDILLYDDLVIDEPDLSIPHARLLERDFMLRPLLDLNPDAQDPRTKQLLKEVLKSLSSENTSIIFPPPGDDTSDQTRSRS